MAVEERIRRCGTWWQAKDEGRRFILYYTCLRTHYQMPAQEAFTMAKQNWRQMRDLVPRVQRAIRRC